MSEPQETQVCSAPQEADLLLEVVRPGYHLRLRLANQQMECRGDLDVKLPPFGAGGENEPVFPPAEEMVSAEPRPWDSNPPAESLSPEKLLEFLRQCGIQDNIDLAAVQDFCAAGEQGHCRQSMLLASGQNPIAGKDGWFEMAVKIAGDQVDFEEDARGNVDLRTLHTFTEIEPGQKLGTVHPPKEGTAGRTVHGLPIPAEPGKPYKLVAGDGVVLKYGDRVAFAEKAGRALFDQQRLSVVDELVISGDLSLKVGNLDFHGFIEIKGDVPDEFSVKAKKGLRITGTIGACQIESGGPLEIGSMAGKETGQIICHGDLKASFLNQVKVACYGNVQVSNEIRNSSIKATGKIVVERGSIVGGKCLALEGIEARILGTTSGLKTHLSAGIYFPDADRFDYLRERLKQVNKQLKTIHAAIGPLERFREKGALLDKASELRLSILNQQWEKLEQEKDDCHAELEASRPQVFSNCNPKINALKAIKEGVTVSLGQSVEEFKTEISGPVSLIENAHHGSGLLHLKYSPLSKLAAVITAELREKEQGQS